MMKKLALMVILLMGFNTLVPISNVFAADDTDEDMAALESLMNSDDSDNVDTNEADANEADANEADANEADANEADTNTDEQADSNEDDNNENEKVWLELSGEVADTAVTLSLTPIDGYTTYKIYYNKDGDSNVNEKLVEYDWQEPTEVDITGLEPNTEYTFIAKAFDNDGNPVESTASEPVNVKTAEPKHAAPADNVIYNPTIKAYEDKIVITYKPGLDVKTVQISMSDDGQTFKPVARVDAKTTSYTIPVEKSGTKYVKLVPIADDGTTWVCKIWSTEVSVLKAVVKKPTKTAEKNVGKAKTGPETYFLIILAVLAYVVYARRKIKA